MIATKFCVRDWYCCVADVDAVWSNCCNRVLRRSKGWSRTQEAKPDSAPKANVAYGGILPVGAEEGCVVVVLLLEEEAIGDELVGGRVAARTSSEEVAAEAIVRVSSSDLGESVSNSLVAARYSMSGSAESSSMLYGRR